MRWVIAVVAMTLAAGVALPATAAAPSSSSGRAGAQHDGDELDLEGRFKGFDARHRLMLRLDNGSLLFVVVPRTVLLPRLRQSIRIEVRIRIVSRTLVLERLEVKQATRKERKFEGRFRGFDSRHRLALGLDNGKVLFIVVPRSVALPALRLDVELEVRVVVQRNRLVLQKLEVKDDDEAHGDRDDHRDYGR